MLRNTSEQEKVFEEEFYLLLPGTQKITWQTFRLNAPVVIRAKVKKCEQTLLSYSL